MCISPVQLFFFRCWTLSLCRCVHMLLAPFIPSERPLHFFMFSSNVLCLHHLLIVNVWTSACLSGNPIKPECVLVPSSWMCRIGRNDTFHWCCANDKVYGLIIMSYYVLVLAFIVVAFLLICKIDHVCWSLSSYFRCAFVKVCVWEGGCDRSGTVHMISMSF